jgi:hypothetical protein
MVIVQVVFVWFVTGVVLSADTDVSHFSHEYEDSMFLRNVGICLQEYTVSPTQGTPILNFKYFLDGLWVTNSVHQCTYIENETVLVSCNSPVASDCVCFWSPGPYCVKAIW